MVSEIGVTSDSRELSSVVTETAPTVIGAGTSRVTAAVEEMTGQKTDMTGVVTGREVPSLVSETESTESVKIASGNGPSGGEKGAVKCVFGFFSALPFAECWERVSATLVDIVTGVDTRIM